MTVIMFHKIKRKKKKKERKRRNRKKEEEIELIDLTRRNRERTNKPLIKNNVKQTFRFSLAVFNHSNVYRESDFIFYKRYKGESIAASCREHVLRN